jgi:hypothetical protein
MQRSVEEVNMTDLGEPLSSLPPRPLEIDEEIPQLKENNGIEAAFNDDTMIEDDGMYAYAHNLIFITGTTVSAVVYIEDDEAWYRAYSEDRPDAVLADAYDAVRDIRDEETLFDRHALTVGEAVFEADRPSQEQTSGYEDGDAFDCPVCDGTHTVQFHEDEYMKDHPTDTSYLYVECPEARNDTLRIEYQAKTPS